jgi:hypothetical protein
VSHRVDGPTVLRVEWVFCNIVSRERLNSELNLLLTTRHFMQDEQVEDLIRELKSLNLRRNEIFAQLEVAYTGHDGEEAARRPTRDSVANGINKGDRIRIRNKVKKPAAWTRPWDKEKERIATVTRVTATQVHYITDNGVETWRAPNNVERVSTR